MFAIPSMLVSWVMGWSVARVFMGRESWRPAGLRWTLEVSLGWAAGTAISSALFFALVWTGAPGYLTPALEVFILAACLYRGSTPRPAGGPRPAFGWNWILRIGTAITFGFLLFNFAAATTCMPDGQWDALFVWNVRGRFLAGGPGVWRGAVTGTVQGMPVGLTHPDYPFSVSAFLARTWALGGDFDASVPIISGLVYSLALVGLLGSALAWLASETIGLIAMMTMFCCELFLTDAAFQYVDIPLALYGLASLVLLAAARRRDASAGLLILSGAMAGAGAWTKNEGIVLLPLLLVTALVFAGRRALAWMTAGALPWVLLTGAFKVFLAPPTTAPVPLTLHDVLGTMAEPGRWELVSRYFLMNLYAVSDWWAHPVLLLGGAALVLGLVPRPQRFHDWRLFLAPAGLLAADLAVLLTTRSDLTWNLETVTDRLVLQVLPSLVFVFALTIRPPAVEAVPLPPEKPRRKSRKHKR